MARSALFTALQPARRGGGRRTRTRTHGGHGGHGGSHGGGSHGGGTQTRTRTHG